MGKTFSDTAPAGLCRMLPESANAAQSVKPRWNDMSKQSSIFHGETHRYLVSVAIETPEPLQDVLLDRLKLAVKTIIEDNLGEEVGSLEYRMSDVRLVDISRTASNESSTVFSNVAELSAAREKRSSNATDASGSSTESEQS